MPEKISMLFVTSYYSALRSSLENGAWQPHGMPAIVKLFEALGERKIPFHALLLNKASHNPPAARREIRFGELKANFKVLSGNFALAGIPVLGKILDYANRGLFMIFILAEIFKQKPAIVYMDRENVVYGALLALLLPGHVVLRLHGVTGFYGRFALLSYRIKHPLRYLSFRAPFKQIICSEDGTPASFFLNRFTNRKVEKILLLNGVDKTRRTSGVSKNSLGIPAEHKVVLFVSRFDFDKGAEIFAEAILRLNMITTGFTAIMVGDGPLFKKIQGRVKAARNIKLLGSLPHHEMPGIYGCADIFVSLNELGNLCNTVLEALHAGNCIITYKKDDLTLRDVSTEVQLKDIAVFIDRADAVPQLVSKLQELLAGENLTEIKRNTRQRAQQLLQSWQARCAEEIDLILNHNRH